MRTKEIYYNHEKKRWFEAENIDDCVFTLRPLGADLPSPEEMRIERLEKQIAELQSRYGYNLDTE